MDERVFGDLLAKQEITEVLHDYCRAMDRIDDELGRSVFHPDAVADYGPMFQGTGYGFIDFVHVAHSSMQVQMHRITNVSIRVDGSRAGSEAYVKVTARTKTQDGKRIDLHSRGRYIDQWEKRNGRWAISHRRYLHEMDESRPVEGAFFPTAGRRDRTDPSYAALGAKEE